MAALRMQPCAALESANAVAKMAKAPETQCAQVTWSRGKKCTQLAAAPTCSGKCCTVTLFATDGATSTSRRRWTYAWHARVAKATVPLMWIWPRYKAEFLAHYWAGRVRPIHAYAFGWIDKWARLASLAPGFANLFTQLPGLRDLAKMMVGVPRRRQIPAFAAQTFREWFRRRKSRLGTGLKVLLWADTFNNYFMPETAQAAVEVLEHAGCEVEVLDQHLCCGRPLYDYGFLDMAKSYLRRNLTALRPHISANTPMVVLEPSCCSVFRDELHNSFPESSEAKRSAENTFTLSEFLEKKIPGYQPPEVHREAVVQGHCHHKAVMRMKDEKSLMEKMQLDHRVLESGCCGMAGAFGYEKDKYQVSIACGERSLLPEVRKAPVSTIVMADGFSCKEQIAQETDRHALHCSEVLKLGFETGENHVPTMYPERYFVEPREKAQKRSMARAAVIGGLALAMLGLAWMKSRRP